MGFLKRAIRRGVSDAVGKAVGQAVRQAVEPAATDLANRAAQQINQANAQGEQYARRTMQTSGLEGALGNLQRSVESYATEAAKSTKICPGCEQVCGADKKFCPNCGTKLPEMTVAQGAVCPSCGKQNSIGTKFCADCGTKLPAALAEEQAAQARADAVMADWDRYLAAYPKWCCGGRPAAIEPYDGGYIMLAVEFDGNAYAARQAVEQYRQVLAQYGFRPAGEYPSREQLYARINGVCYHVDTEHCFDGDSDCPTLYFNVGEPSGGFDYVKPEPKKATNLFDLFK